MKTKLIWVSALLIIGGFTACSSSDNKNEEEATKDANEAGIEASAPTDSAASAQKEDADFVMEAASGGMMEVELGKMAMDKAISSKVKDFAKMMVDDHTKANNELKSLASQKNIMLSGSLMEKHQKLMDNLAKKSGKEFDKEYMDKMVDDHKEDIEAFEKAAEKGNDSDVKSFASKTLPTLRHHLEMAERTEKITDKM